MDSKNITPVPPKGQANPVTGPLDEFEKALRCLALEVPESIHADVMARYEAMRAAEFEALYQVTNSCLSLLVAAKLTVMESADLVGETVLSGTASDALNEAIETAGGWTEAEQAKLETLALGENIPEEGA